MKLRGTTTAMDDGEDQSDGEDHSDNEDLTVYTTETNEEDWQLVPLNSLRWISYLVRESGENL